MKFNNKIIAFICVFAILLSISGIAYADFTSQPNTLWETYLQNNESTFNILDPLDFGINFWTQWTGAQNVCTSSSDGLHHSSEITSIQYDEDGVFGQCLCDDCNTAFKYRGADLEQDYNNAISDSGYANISANSDGTFNMYITGDLVYTINSGTFIGNTIPGGYYPYGLRVSTVVQAPVYGVYKIKTASVVNMQCVNSYGIENKRYSTTFVCKADTSNYLKYIAGGYTSQVLAEGEYFHICFANNEVCSGGFTSISMEYESPTIIKIEPVQTLSTPVNITQNINNVYQGNDTFYNPVNTTNNQFYDISNDTYNTITNYEYNYDNRQYFITLDDGREVNVTYGTDNITVQIGEVINNYYYGYNECEPSPDHVHNWSASPVNERTCTTPGITTYTCDECGEAYTDVVPAIGHVWDDGVSYDAVIDPDTGEITEQAYIQYTCTVCGETFTSYDVNSPPGSGISETNDIWWQNLFTWLNQFKLDLSERINSFQLSVEDLFGDLTLSIDNSTNSSSSSNIENYDQTIDNHEENYNESTENNDFTYVYNSNGDGTEDDDTFSFKDDFLAKFGIIKDLWDVGKYVVNIVSSDAANAYSFDVNEALAIDTGG